MPQTAPKDYGWSIVTTSADVIEQNIAEMDWESLGMPIIQSVDINWDAALDEIGKLERNAFMWLERQGEAARDEGHGSVDELVGTLWVHKNTKWHRTIKECIESQEPIFVYDLPQKDYDFIYKDINVIIAASVDVEFWFWK